MTLDDFQADPRMFAEYNNEVYKSYLPTSSMSKTLRLLGPVTGVVATGLAEARTH